jgi:translation initiation factor IF-3
MEAGMDLVEVSPMAKPPVCKIMDYGKFKYETKKKANEAKKKQTVVKLKELKLRPRTEEHDYDVKLRQAREFLEEGHKIKVTIVFRGREIAHREIGQRQLQDMVADLKDVAIVEQPPRMEGKAMFMLLGANPKAPKPKPAPIPSAAAGAANAAKPAAPPVAAPTPAPAAEGAPAPAAAPAAPRPPKPAFQPAPAAAGGPARPNEGGGTNV